jgi:hypothetical protein
MTPRTLQTLPGAKFGPATTRQESTGFEVLAAGKPIGEHGRHELFDGDEVFGRKLSGASGHGQFEQEFVAGAG